MRKGWSAAALVCLFGCSDPERERLKATTKPTYDEKTGKLAQLTYDADKNGRIDTWTDMDGARALRSRIDRNEDGRIDRWEYYGADGRLLKVGFSRRDEGTPDAWAFSTVDGKVERIEVSSTFDERKVDRWEYYDPSVPVGPDGGGAMIRVEEDTDADGRPDKWESYANGAIASAAFDENGDGTPDRRLTYDGPMLVLIESEPDASGRYRKRIEVE